MNKKKEDFYNECGTLLGLGACQADLDLIDMLIRREKNEDR